VNRNFTGITVVVVILIIDVLIYKNQNANCSDKALLRCLPARDIYSFKDSAGRIKHDSIFLTISTLNPLRTVPRRSTK